MVEYRLKHGNKKFMNDFTDAKGEFKLPEDLAGGGIAGMLGEPTYADENHRVPLAGGGGLKAALEIIMKKFGKDAITTASKLERPLKEGQVIQFPKDKITDWTKPRPTTGKKAEVIDTSFKSGVDTSGKRVTMSNDDYADFKDKWFSKIIANTDDAINTWLKKGINASD